MSKAFSWAFSIFCLHKFDRKTLVTYINPNHNLMCFPFYMLKILINPNKNIIFALQIALHGFWYNYTKSYIKTSAYECCWASLFHITDLCPTAPERNLIFPANALCFLSWQECLESWSRWYLKYCTVQTTFTIVCWIMNLFWPLLSRHDSTFYGQFSSKHRTEMKTSYLECSLWAAIHEPYKSHKKHMGTMYDNSFTEFEISILLY